MKDARSDVAVAAEAEHIAVMWDRGWRRYVFPSLWLIYLSQIFAAVHRYQSGVTAIVGYLVVAAFAVTYLAALVSGMQGNYPRFWRSYALAVALTLAGLYFAHQDALGFLVYLAVLTMATQRPVAVLIVLGFAATATFLPALVPAWDQGVNWSLGFTLVLVALAMFGFFKIVRANIELAAARAEVARLAAENERTRIARDLHDLLGHSLTTITVKAGLARRLAERGDDERARVEIAEVEQLSRRTLGDVRAAVSAHRETTLAGELATAREVLRAAGIDGTLPPTVADVDPDVEQLFGWVVREGVTNAVRHSRAAHLRIELGPRRLEISDDGRGGDVVKGNGLTGLQERVEAYGGRLTVRGGTTGFTLRVDVPEPARDTVGVA